MIHIVVFTVCIVNSKQVTSLELVVGVCVS